MWRWRTALIAGVTLASCEKAPDTFHSSLVAGRSASAEALPAHKIPAPELTALLEVTWLVPGQPPQTSQTTFTNMTKCVAARDAALSAGKETRERAIEQNTRDAAEASAELATAADEARSHGGWLSGLGPGQERKLRGAPLPDISAVCLTQ